jgi:SH3-like domain-containing protein
VRTATASLSLLCAGLAFAAAAGAAEFRSVAEPAAILYDAPSAKAKRLYIVNRGYPVELVVQVEGWAKVRDAAGDLSWIESRHLADKRMVLVNVALAAVRQGADEGAPVVFQAQQNVLLELVEPPAGAWLHVRHRDGQAGYIKATHVWGA